MNPKTLLLFSIVVSLVSCSPKKLTKEDLLVGKWRDSNSTVEYFPDGTKIGIYDSGMRMKGKWIIENDIIVFTLSNNKRFKYNEHKILKLNKDEMVLENMASHVVYPAKRVTDGVHLEFKRPASNQKAEQGAAANP